MKFAMFRRNDAKKVTRVAGVPIHGLERDADGVMLHLQLQGGEKLALEIPRAVAPEMRDYLRKIIEALDHWDAIDTCRRHSTPRAPTRALEMHHPDGRPVKWERGFDWKF